MSHEALAKSGRQVMDHNPNKTRQIHNHNKSMRANETISYMYSLQTGTHTAPCLSREQQHKLQSRSNTWKDRTFEDAILGTTRGLRVS